MYPAETMCTACSEAANGKGMDGEKNVCTVRPVLKTDSVSVSNSTDSTGNTDILANIVDACDFGTGLTG